MPDIHVQKGRKQCHIIVACSDRGKRWILDNIKAIVVENGGDLQIPISSEFAEEIGNAIRKDGLDVDVD